MYSKHIFLFPFRWDYCPVNCSFDDADYESRTDLNSLCKSLNPAWQAVNQFSIDDSTDYNARTYFYPFVRSAIFPDPKDTFHKQYQFDLGEEAVYTINTTRKDAQEANKSFSLDIEQVGLHLYDLGIGVLTFNLSNKTYPDAEDILLINEYGRRLFPAFLSTGFDISYTQNSFLAKSISLTNKSGTLAIHSHYGTGVQEQYREKSDFLPPHILQLLGKSFTDQPVPQSGQIRVLPVLDDRMFVLSWYGNTELAEKLSPYDTTIQRYANLSEDKDYWYRYIFVDTSSVTCPDPVLKQKILEKATYTRWIPEKTFFGVSRYSFVMLTNTESFAQNILRPHLASLYDRLVLLLLVQRSALLRFSAEVTTISRNFFNDERDDVGKVSDQVKKLYEDYILFNNRILFREITAQEQGIELYDQLRETLRIQETADEVGKEIAELNNYLQVATSENERQSLDRLSLLGGLFLVPGFILSYFGLGILNFRKLDVSGIGYALIGLVLVVLVGAALLAYSRKSKPFLSDPGKRTGAFVGLLILISGAIVIPASMSYVRSADKENAQSVVDSATIQRIDSLQAEIRRLRLQTISPARPSSQTSTSANPK